MRRNGATSWELLGDAWESAMFPTLREFHFNLEYDFLNLIFGTNLCVSTLQVPVR